VELGLEGTSAIVTGGSAGIGAAVVRALAREGCDVAVIDVAPELEAAGLLREVEALGRRARFVQADVASFDDAERAVRSAMDAFGRLDILVCSAGISRDAVVWKMTEEQWDRVIDVNLKGCFNCNRAAALVFKNQKHGKIVNISSINGIRGKFGQANYAASKAGVIGLTKSLARELGKWNVNVNAVAPGLVMTEMSRATPEDALAASLAETVLGRFASPEEVADLVAFLSSERSRHITGEIIKIDGGQYI
jgi:3-oxoacyl-[acyl-carrier protein] reductase